jgi:putative redox protein
MNTTATAQYTGALRCSLHHTRSGQELTTDAPTDNNGRGEAFSPTDLTAASLLVCSITTLGILMQHGRLPQHALHGSVLKHMSTDSPRRIVQLDMQLVIEAGNTLTPEQRHLLEATATGCPVARSLHPEVQQVVSFVYTD